MTALIVCRGPASGGRLCSNCGLGSPSRILSHPLPVLTDSLCAACISQCSACTGNTFATCLTCNSGYFLDSGSSTCKGCCMANEMFFNWLISHLITVIQLGVRSRLPCDQWTMDRWVF